MTVEFCYNTAEESCKNFMILQNVQFVKYRLSHSRQPRAVWSAIGIKLSSVCLWCCALWL